jgi:hypothetical protein
MIASDRELSDAQSKIADLHIKLRALFQRTDLTHFEVHVTAAGYDGLIARLQQEVNDYESRSAAAVTPRS